jgi:hypothetical protein
MPCPADRDQLPAGPDTASLNLQLEDKPECSVDAADLLVAEVSRAGAQPTGIDGGGLFGKDPGQLALLQSAARGRFYPHDGAHRRASSRSFEPDNRIETTTCPAQRLIAFTKSAKDSGAGQRVSIRPLENTREEPSTLTI